MIAKNSRTSLATLLAIAASGLSIVPVQAADSLLNWTDLKHLKIYHAYAASDGESYVEEINVPALESPSFEGSKAQTYFDFKEPHRVRIGRGAQGAMFDWHGAVDYRHLIIPMQGNLFFDLGEGRTLELKPGEAILAEDWTGRGHRSGCAPSKTQATCVGMDILIDANPRTMPLRAPPRP